MIVADPLPSVADVKAEPSDSRSDAALPMTEVGRTAVVEGAAVGTAMLDV